MYGGKISNNVASYGAGGVYNVGALYNNGCFVMYGGKISGNTAVYYCGGVYYHHDDVFEWVGGVISGNTSPVGDDVSNVMTMDTFV